jgi:hypothetical protein
MTSSKPKGPTREQLTDRQWSAVCHLFDVILRCDLRLSDPNKGGSHD